MQEDFLPPLVAKTAIDQILKRTIDKQLQI